MPPSAEKGGSSARISLARSSWRGQEEHRLVKSAHMAPLALEAPALGAADEIPAAPKPTISRALMTVLLPPSAAPPLPVSSAPAAVLGRSLLEMTRL